MLKWVRLQAGLYGPPTSLQAHGYEVARLGRCADGRWQAITRRNLPHELQHKHVCQSYESGKAGCEAWARRHEDALLAWGLAKHQAWVAEQRWRKADDPS